MTRSPSRGPAAVRALLRRFLLHLLAGALIMMVGAAEASAQLVRASSSNVITSAGLAFGADAAYDPVNGVYLVVMARETREYPYQDWLVGVFVDRAGTIIGTEFLMGLEPVNLSRIAVNLPRVVYSPHVSNGAGGTGGFLVTWTDGDTIYSRRVAFPGVNVGAVVELGLGYGVQELAYSATSRMFLAAWTDAYAPRSVSFTRVAVDGLPAGVPTRLVAAGDAGASWVTWNSVTDVTWHSTRNEFGILYVKRASPWALRFARVTPAGMLLDDRFIATLDAEPMAAAMEFSPLTGNYIALWADRVTGRITGLELSADGAVLATGPLPPSIVGGQLGMALAYNRVSGTFLLLGFSQVPVRAEQIRGLELNKHGAPHSPVIDVTAVPLNANLMAPRVVGRSDAPEWLVNAESAAKLHYVQIVSTSSTAGGSELLLNGCYGPDPFAALGGGTCSNGGWLPPLVSPGTDGPTPAPPPSTPTGCATPDPFALLGGGTCYNGGWLPPGMPAPSQPPTQEPAPPLPPPPTPPSNDGGCSTADPFASLGGGTCYNGGWLPPGMPVPSAPALPPATPPPPAPTQGCATADPFASLGGGTCYNGGWLPPGMPAPEGSDDSPPPVPPSNDTCATPDPFSTLPSLIGECRNGAWVPIVAITVTGTLSRRVELGNAWGVVTEATIYQLLGEVPPELQIEGLRVSVKGTQPDDIVSVWPVLQVYSIVAR